MVVEPAAGANTSAPAPDSSLNPYIVPRADGSPGVDVVVSFPALLPEPGGERPAGVAADYAPAAAAAAAWAPTLAALCPTCAISLASGDRLVVAAPAAAARRVALWAAASPATHWAAPRARRGARNFYAASIIQSGTAGAASVQQDGTWAGPAPASTPHWVAGLRGQGAVLGMGDTGVDIDHCAFRDDKEKVVVRAGTSSVGGAPAFASATHRKIALYRALADSVDAAGHGTHCAGTAVGAPGGAGGGAALSPRQGGAPAARLAFTDIGSGAGGELGVPMDLVANYFPYHYDR